MVVTVAASDPGDPGRCVNCGHHVQVFFPGGKPRHDNHLITCGRPTWDPPTFDELLRGRPVTDVPVGDRL